MGRKVKLRCRIPLYTGLMKFLVHAAVILGTMFGSDMKLNRGEETRAFLNTQTPKRVLVHVHRQVMKLSRANGDYLRRILD